MKKTILLLSMIGIGLVEGCKEPTLSTPALQPLKQVYIPQLPPSIKLHIHNYRPSGGNSFKNIVVSNLSSVISRGHAYYSQAADGLTDEFKTGLGASFGFSISHPYTGSAGYSNLVLYHTGISANQQVNLTCPNSTALSPLCTKSQASPNNCAGDGLTYTPQLSQSSVFLGLTDCEKRFLNLDINQFDSNGSGIPDYLKLRCGMNPLNPNDGSVSLTNDSLSNVEKCKLHLPFDETGSGLSSTFSYQYKTIAQADGSTDFAITNIGILGDHQENVIAVYIIETQPSSQQSVLSSAYLTVSSGAEAPVIVDYWGLKTNVHILPTGATQ